MPSLAKRREEWLVSIPWIRMLKKKEVEQCQGIKWNKVALRDIYTTGQGENEKPPRGIQPQARCKNKARYMYTWPKPAKAEKLCTAHVYSHGLDGSMEEQNRLARWKAKTAKKAANEA